MEGGGDYIPIATLSPPDSNDSLALRWAAMRAILTFNNCEGQSHNTVSTDHCRRTFHEAFENLHRIWFRRNNLTDLGAGAKPCM